MGTEKVIEKVASAPAVVLDKTIDASKNVAKQVSEQSHVKKAREYWRMLGPGLTTGAADDDPSGIATYSQTGSQYGFQLLWLAGFTFPLMSVVQEMCARIGMVTGRGLAGTIKLYFPKWVLLICSVLLFAANSLNIGANLGAMAKSTQLLLPTLDFSALVIFFTVFSLALQIFTPYESYAKYLKWLALVLLAYILSALIVNPDWNQVLMGAILPSITFSKDQIFMVCAILGTTISPYLFFWQTSQEVEEKILGGKTNLALRQEEITKKEINNMRVDVWSGMFLSNIVMFFIIAASAATLYTVAGGVEITSAAQAAEALRPIAGDNAFLLFALGIIGTGLLSVPVLAGSASYALSESFGWKEGLYRNLKGAPAFYGVIILSMLIGIGVNFSGLDPMKALIYSAVANGLVAPFILALIVLISSSKKIMGDRVNHPIITGIGWIVTILMFIAGAAAIASFFL